MARLGADADQLERLARTFGDRARRTQDMKTELDAHMRQTWWVGAYSDNFRRYWYGTARANMQRVAEALLENERILRRQANDQRQTSTTKGMSAASHTRNGSNLVNGSTSRAGQGGIATGLFAGLIGVGEAVVLPLINELPEFLGSVNPGWLTIGPNVTRATHLAVPIATGIVATGAGTIAGFDRWIDDLPGDFTDSQRYGRAIGSGIAVTASTAALSLGGAALLGSVGGAFGASTGAAAGMALGSFAGPPGMLLGGALGSSLGGFAGAATGKIVGGFLGGVAADYVAPSVSEFGAAVGGSVGDAVDAVGDAGEALISLSRSLHSDRVRFNPIPRISLL